MADLDFSHRVQEIPAAEKLPNPVQRSVTAEVVSNPDVQGAVSNYAANSNWMSNIGATVASRASNAIASKLGGELGKNPQGDLGPVLTDFDKTMHEAYQTQANATLGLQAHKLINDSNLEMSKAVRVTPDLIAKTNKNIAIGLQNIFKNAPQEIRPHLESQYGQIQMNQTADLSQRMIREQKEDMRDNGIYSSKVNAENAYSLAIKGNHKAADAAVEATRRANQSLVAMKLITPEQAKVNIDTAKKSAESGKLIHEYENSSSKEAYLKKVATNVKDVQSQEAAHNLLSYVSQQHALRAEQENLLTQQMYNKIIADPTAISGIDWADYESNVTPLQAAKTKFKWLKALHASDAEGMAVDALIKNFESAEAQANASPKIQNKAYNKSVDAMIAKNPTMSRDQAEVQVAASAGSTIPVFTKTLQNALWSGDPAQMVARARQIEDLQQTGNGHALTGLSESDFAIASDISHSNNPVDPSWAARVVTENKENQDPVIRKSSEAAFSNLLYKNTTQNNTSTDDWILGKFGLQGGMFHAGFDSQWMKGHYADDILTVYKENYINTRRDENRADELTKNYIERNYGKTAINGSSQWTKHPIEKACGLNEGEGLPSINKDIIRQTQEPMSHLKKLYDDNVSDHYWSIEEVGEVKKETGAQSFPAHPREEAKPGRLQFVKHTRNGVSTNTERYPLILVGNNFNWELNVQTKDGPRSVFLAAPDIGVHKYTPDTNWIRDDYLGRYHSFPSERISKNVKDLLTSAELKGE